jgi:hypothetical protein
MTHETASALDTENDELRIDVAREPGRVVTRAGHKFLAEVFVHQSSDLHPGSETLLDRLNHPRERFLPCRVGGRDELLHLDQLAMIEQDDPPPELTALDELNAFHEGMEMELVTGQTLRGELVYLAPSGRSRISDLLNHPTDRFLLTITGEVYRYVHLGAVVRVRF